MDSITTTVNKTAKRKRTRAACCSRCGHACPNCNAQAPAHQHKKPTITAADQEAQGQSIPDEAAAVAIRGEAAGAGSSLASSSEVTVTVAVKAEPVVDDTPVPSPAPAARAVWVPTPLDVGTVIRPPAGGDKGEGQPLAPPGWHWGVGVRKVKCGTMWRDRTLAPSSAFLAKYGGKRERLRSKVQLKHYIGKFHPEVSFQAVLDSFVWNVPA